MIHVLLIEDDIIDQKAFRREVKASSFTSHVVSSVKEAREYLTQNPCEVIVADYWLGDGTAFDILNEFRHIPMIIITSVGDEDVAVQAIKMGAYDYLVKDLNLAYLKKLPVAIENAMAHQQLAEAERDQRAFADALRDIATALNTSLELEEVLNRILQNVQRVVPHDASNIMLIK
ncbi:MAG: response regulator, partial [Anaerolineae bacterium]|nr:response regulator [Anaerolineae bacterium]